MNTPHKHAELIKAWADGAEIQFLQTDSAVWKDCSSIPGWYAGYQYRIKPELVYPKSTLTFEEAHKLMWPTLAVSHSQEFYEGAFQRIGDAAVKKYIQENENKS